MAQDSVKAVRATSGSRVGAIEAALASGDLDRAVRLYEEGGRTASEQLLAAVQDAGSPTPENAAKMYLLARDFRMAARLYEHCRQWPDAANMYEECGELASAARCHKRSGDLPRAAKTYDVAGNSEQALILYEKLGLHKERADCLARSGQPFAAAQVYRELGNVRAEVETLRRVPDDAPERLASVRRLTVLLLQRNRVAEATQLVAETLRDHEDAKQDPALHELLAELFEKQGQASEAAGLRARAATLPRRDRLVADAGPAGEASASPATSGADGYALLKALPLFAKLSLADMKDLDRIAAEVTFQPGSILVETGVDAPGLLVLVEGTAEVLALGAEGTRHLNLSRENETEAATQ